MRDKRLAGGDGDWIQLFNGKDLAGWIPIVGEQLSGGAGWAYRNSVIISGLPVKENTLRV